jgi:hypothetical protein
VPGGLLYGAPSLVPLIGGSQGGNALAESQGNTITVAGGGGGGALQLVSCSSLVVRGVIDVSGAGGLASTLDPTPTIGGSGGGSGGSVLLEGMEVDIQGDLSARGGGGGGGSTAPDSPGTNALGVVAGLPGGGQGGGLIPPGSGEDRSPDGSGGGGGAVGRIRINVPPGASPSIDDVATVIPAPSVGQIQTESSP